MYSYASDMLPLYSVVSVINITLEVRASGISCNYAIYVNFDEICRTLAAIMIDHEVGDNSMHHKFA